MQQDSSPSGSIYYPYTLSESSPEDIYISRTIPSTATISATPGASPVVLSATDSAAENSKHEEGRPYFVGSELATPTQVPEVKGLSTKNFDPTMLWMLFYAGFVVAIVGAIIIFKKHSAK